MATTANLPERVAPAVAQVLGMHDIGQDFVEREVTAMDEIRIAKTSNRSLVGTMNEFEFQAEVYRDHSGITDLLELAMRLAAMPCGAIKDNSPARLLRELATGARH